MRYKRSIHRNDFDKRLAFLLRKCRRASRLRSSDADIRDLVFQCAILQTSAAIEQYLKLLIESWAQNVRIHSRANRVPVAARVFLASTRLDRHFSEYIVNRYEAELLEKLSKESTLLWKLILGDIESSSIFDGKQIYREVSYPSSKNIKRLFSRLGISNIYDLISKEMKKDSETAVDGFQSIRTALAHSEPPNITIKDVEDKLNDMRLLVGAIDQIFYRRVVSNCGKDCWR